MVHFNPIDNNNGILRGGFTTKMSDPVAELLKIDFKNNSSLDTTNKGLSVEREGLTSEERIENSSVENYQHIKKVMPKADDEKISDKEFFNFATNYGFNSKYVTPETALHAAFNPYFA